MNSIEKEIEIQQKHLTEITPALMRTDISALKELLIAFQKRATNMLTVTKLEEKEIIAELHSQIRSSQIFVNWIEHNINIMNGGEQ